jgi:PLP dependent protein
MESALSAEIITLGESRVPETEKKITFLKNRQSIELHMIGHLQSNKVKKALDLYDVIQTVDSIKLAKKISSLARQKGIIQSIYLQVNSGADPLKYGFSKNETILASLEIAQMSNLKIEGIMMIPPYIKMDSGYRSIYSQTRELRDQIVAEGILSCTNLSMGMSRDFELAIEEGATHVRIGTALFGTRR